MGFNTVDYRTTKKVYQDEPAVAFNDYIAEVEDKRNKKNDSHVMGEKGS